MQFEFRGRDSAGALQQGALEAASSDAAANELVRRGITPLQIDEQQRGRSRAWKPGCVRCRCSGARSPWTS